MPLPQPSSARDRTPEFQLLVERLQKQLGSGPGATNGAGSGRPGGPGDRSQQIQQHSDFARKAADIGHGIHKASLKLAKLAQLAKRTSMFDDPAAEVDELTGLIKSDIQGLNNAIADLQRLSARDRREDSKQSAEHTNTVVDSLRARLKDATQQFKDVLTVRTDNLKHHKERRQLFSSADADAALTPLLHSARAGGGASSSHFDAGPLPTAAALHGHQPLQSHPSQQLQQQQQAHVPSFMQQAQTQLTLAAPQETYMSARAEALRNVESTIVELGSIFNKLSEMVAAQGELAVRIDENVDDTLANVTDAQAQLLKYLHSISSNRWLVLKVFAVLMAFVVLFIMFIA